MVQRLSLTDQGRDQPVNSKKFLLREGYTCAGISKKATILFMCVVAQVDLLLQCTERTFATAVADIRRLDMTRADFFFEVGTVYVAYAAPTAKLKLFWRIAYTANPCLLASIPIFQLL